MNWILTLTFAVLLCAPNPARGGPSGDPLPSKTVPAITILKAAPIVSPTPASWTRLGPAELSGPRLGTFAVYDPVGDRMVLFGGYNAGYLDDTWSLALGGAKPLWARLAQAGAHPGARAWHGEVYDPVRRRMLVIGGSNAGGYLIDVWQLDLAAAEPAWSPVATAGTPPAARECRGAFYDPVRDRVLLFGGFGNPDHFNDTWSLDLSGTPTWHPLSPSGLPPAPRRAMSLAYDPVGDRMLMFGGRDQVQFMNDLWALSLSGDPAWQKLLPTGTAPPARYGQTATYDPVRREMMVFGGYGGSFLDDMYVLSLSGTPAWSPVTTQPRPSRRDFHTVAYDPPRDRMVLIGGNAPTGALRDLWAMNPATRAWSNITPAIAVWPGARLGTFAVHDPVRDRLVLYGGYNAGDLDDTWSLALGAAEPEWTRIAETEASPGARAWHGEVYDPVRQRILVIGGSDVADGYLNDVWQLDLAAATPEWSQVATAGTPPAARECRGALYDPVRDRVLLFGGYGSSQHFNDTWALDLAGTPTWRKLSPSGQLPAPRRAMSVAYDAAGDRLLVFGGFDEVRYMNDLWALKLAGRPSWQRLNPVGVLPAPRCGATGTYDPIRHQLVVLGGYGGQFLGDGFALRLDRPLKWSPIVAAGSAPGIRNYHTVEYDPASDRFVLYGGDDAGALEDLWTLSFGGAAAIARSQGAEASGDAPPGADAAVARALRGGELEFALAGFVPNPARAGFRVVFSLPDASPARLELFDLAGRVVRSMSLDAPWPGRQNISFDRSDALRPGVYMVRLTQGRRTMSTRGAIVP